MLKQVVTALSVLTVSTAAGAQINTIAKGSNVAFHHEVTTSAPASAVWSVWTDVEGWNRWDQGLKSARLDGPFVSGARGTLVPLSGPSSKFVVADFSEGNSYRFATSLPLARLNVTRTIVSSGPNKPTVFRHDVRFSGLLGSFWAQQFGPQFRVALPPSMNRVAELAESAQKQELPQ